MESTVVGDDGLNSVQTMQGVSIGVLKRVLLIVFILLGSWTFSGTLVIYNKWMFKYTIDTNRENKREGGGTICVLDSMRIAN